MEGLESANLFGAGLVRVDTPTLVARYNACLEELGIPPTSLGHFSVDGIGWSPEIAKERGDLQYLSHGAANQLGVVVSPDQRGKPVFFPISSYDRRLMRHYFDRFEKAIIDITTTSCIAIEFDNGISRYISPRDLLLVDYVVVRSTAGSLIENTRQQLALAERLGHGDNWFDPELRAAFAQSARLHGDLRFRRVDIPDMRFEDLRSFYTTALGGVFVLRKEHVPDDTASFLIVEEEPYLETLGQRRDDAYWKYDPKLLEFLITEGFVDIDVNRYREHPELLDEKIEYVLVDVLCSSDPKLDYASLTHAQKKSRVMALQNAMPEFYFELEQYAKNIRRGQNPKVSDLSPQLRVVLAHPAGGLATSLAEVIHQLLCRMQPKPLDILELYTWDKNFFYERYRGWTDAKKKWAIAMLTVRYRPRMHMD